MRNVGGNSETITEPGPAQGNDGNVGLMSGDTGPTRRSLHCAGPGQIWALASITGAETWP